MEDEIIELERQQPNTQHGALPSSFSSENVFPWLRAQDERARRSPGWRVLRKVKNGYFATSYGIQNGGLNTATYIANMQLFGWLGEESLLSNGGVWVILVGGAMTALVTTRAYYRELEEYIALSGRPDEVSSSKDCGQVTAAVLGVGNSWGKMLISAGVTYVLSYTLTASIPLSITLAAVTGGGNLSSNIAVLARPDKVKKDHALEKEFIIASMSDVLGNENKIRERIEHDVEAVFPTSRPQNCAFGAILLTLLYAFANALLYLDNSYRLGEKEGALGASASTLSKVFYGLAILLVFVVMNSSNYLGYRPRIGQWCGSSRKPARSCQTQAQRICGASVKSWAWNTVGYSSAFFKGGASTLALVGAPIKVFGVSDPGWIAFFGVIGVLGGLGVTAANAALYAEPNDTAAGQDCHSAKDIVDVVEEDEAYLMEQQKGLSSGLNSNN